MIKATLLADSQCVPTGCRITSFILTYPRFIHSELMTHRQFSRNAASSRAIPVERMIAAVEAEPAMPVEWGTTQRGMQSGPPLSGGEASAAEATWRAATEAAITHARELLERGVHKQIANRLLEPFAHMTTLVTATEWGNFFALRTHPAAQPEFQHLAFAILDAYTNSVPAQLFPGQWHLPFGEKMREGAPLDERLKVCVARCARTSYVSFDGEFTPEQDAELHDRLAASGHWSPFEHPACALSTPMQSGNFVGFEQYRKRFPNECQSHPAAPRPCAS